MYFTIFARVDSIEDASYDREVVRDRQRITETVQRFQFNLLVPGMKDEVRCVIDATNAPAQGEMDRWESDELWVRVAADTLRTLAGDKDGRVWSITTFTATEIREANQQERQQLSQARKAVKAKAKARREEARKARKSATVAA
jgi:hypothetical protein